MENQGLIKVKPVSRGRIGVSLVSTFFVLAMCLLALACRRQAPYSEFVIPDGLTLRTGDIVFREGESAESRAVTMMDTACIYTHTGMVLWHDGRWKVLHAVPNERASKGDKDSVKLEPVEVFFRTDRAAHGKVLRLPLCPDDTLRLQRTALAVLQRQPLFDPAFDDRDNSAFYCTELVWFVFQQALGVDLSQGRRHHLPLFPPVILCSDLLAYPHLEELYAF